MNYHPALIRSRTRQQMFDVQLDHYKPRDWGYQSPKHQIKPYLVLGKGKKRSINLSQKNFTIFRRPIPLISYELPKRELKPAIYRSYILSQIATLPGAVKVDESQIRDDMTDKERIKVVKKKDLCYLDKLKYNYEPNVGYKLELKNDEVKNQLSKKDKNDDNNKKDVKEKNIKKNNKKKYTFSPIRNRPKRKNKIK